MYVLVHRNTILVEKTVLNITYNYDYSIHIPIRYFFSIHIVSPYRLSLRCMSEWLERLPWSKIRYFETEKQKRRTFDTVAAIYYWTVITLKER